MTALRRRSTRILPQKLCATQCCLSARDSQRNFFHQIQPVGSGCPATVAHRDGDIGTKVRWRYGTAVVRRRDPYSETKAPASTAGASCLATQLYTDATHATSTQPDCAIVRFGCDGILEARPSNETAPAVSIPGPSQPIPPDARAKSSCQRVASTPGRADDILLLWCEP
jgi:hypothetical protein